MNRYEQEVIKTLRQEITEGKQKAEYFRERAEHNIKQQKLHESNVAEARDLLYRLGGL